MYYIHLNEYVICSITMVEYCLCIIVEIIKKSCRNRCAQILTWTVNGNWASVLSPLCPQCRWSVSVADVTGSRTSGRLPKTFRPLQPSTPNATGRHGPALCTGADKKLRTNIFPGRFWWNSRHKGGATWRMTTTCGSLNTIAHRGCALVLEVSLTSMLWLV